MNSEITVGTKMLIPATVRGLLPSGDIDWLQPDDDPPAGVPLETLRDVLRRCEWAPEDHWGRERCQVCFGEEPTHKPDCELGRLLSTLDEIAGTPKEEGA